MNQTEIMQKAIETYGEEIQKIVAIEELSELQKEICKSLRGQKNVDHIIEELADVYIMLRQIEMMYGIEWDEVTAKIGFKLARLEGRMDECSM